MLRNLVFSVLTLAAAAAGDRPNIIFFFVDDLGYGDLGCFWPDQRANPKKFDTPALDAMAAQGAKLTHHYIPAPVCAPSRGSLLQGRHQGHCDIRDSQFDKPLPPNHAIASTLKAAGYRTIHIGKDGLAGGEGSVTLTGTGSRNLASHPLDHRHRRQRKNPLRQHRHRHRRGRCLHPSRLPPGWANSEKQHVGMIRRIDESVADILRTLLDLGIDDNTLCVFTSDNGPHNEGNNPRTFESYANMEGVKRDMWEAGIRAPAIVRWPGKIAGASNNPAAIREISYPIAQWDWLPTFCDLAGVTAPAYCDGVSVAPTRTGTGTQRDKGYLYFEFQAGGNTPDWAEFPNHRNDPQGQMQCLRIGKHMGIRTAIASGTENFQIYDVTSDPGQADNLAASLPVLQAEMKYLALAARTVSAWIKTTGSGQLPIIARGPNSNGNKWTFLAQNGRLRIEVTGGFREGSTLINNGQWRHVAATFANDGSPDVLDVQIYIDGVLENTFAAQGTRALATTASIEVRVGSDVQDRFFNGALDEIRIFPRALGPAEISALAAATSASNDSSLWHYRLFADAAPDSADWNRDDDKDGFNRFLGYALGGSPQVADLSIAPFLELTGNSCDFIFNRRRGGVPPSSYIPESALDPSLPSWLPLGAPTVLPHPELPGYDRLRVAVPASDARRFVRLRVDL